MVGQHGCMAAAERGPSTPSKVTGWFLVVIQHRNVKGAFAKNGTVEGIQGDTKDVGLMHHA